MRLARVLVLLIVASLSAAPNPQSQVYRNPEFGIAVPVPNGASLCTYPGEHDHGPTFLLGMAAAERCRDIQRNRHVTIFASYNAAAVTKKLHDFLKWECETPCGRPPANLLIAGLPTEAARVNRSGGWLDIIVVTQAGKPDPAFDPSAPLINYDLRLHTQTRYLDEDLHTFRTVLRTLRLSPGTASLPIARLAPGESARQGILESGRQQSQLIVISAQMEGHALIYRIDGRQVENTRANSLLANLARVVQVRGTGLPALVIVDVRAPFTEVGKLETALDKSGLNGDRRIFVTDFRGGTMNEIHWDQAPIPLPPVH
jgi:hypothetical protein